MNLTTLHLAPDVAKSKLKAVRAAMHGKTDETYKGLEAVYEAVGKFPIVDIAKTIRTAPVFENGLPRLGFARADRKVLHVARYSQEIDFFAHASWNGDSRYRGMSLSVDKMPKRDGSAHGYTPVPPIPPEVRQRMRDRKQSVLKKHHLLWEVESWTMEPDRDPILLRHLAGDYYAAIDQWELTELEASIL